MSTGAYDYIGCLVPIWPNSNFDLQRAAIVGLVVRTLLHAGGDGMARAWFVASLTPSDGAE